MRVILLVLVLAIPRAVVAQERGDQIFAAALGAYAVAAVVDAKTTIDCSRAGLCHEANPVLRPLVDRHGVEFAMGTKLAAQAGVAVTVLLLRPKYKTQTMWAMVGLSAAQIAVDGINYARLQEARRR